MIEVRDADMERDALAIMDAMRDFATRITFADMVATGDALTDAVAAVVTSENIELLVCGEGELTGCLGIGYAPFMWNRDVVLGEEIFWWAAADAPFGTARALYTEARKRIEARGAVPVFRALANSPDGVNRLYCKTGLSLAETVYMGTL
jgi:hypothetical protein